MAWFDDVFADPDIRTGDYLVTRRGAPQFFDGVEQPGEVSTFRTGDASFQPASGQQLRQIPEGLRTDSVAQLWCRAEVRVEPVPDVVTIEGHPHAAWNRDWRVYQVTPWVGHGSQHWIAYLARVE